MEYRIEEYLGVFTIHVKESENDRWSHCNTIGTPLQLDSRSGESKICPTFNNRYSANEKITMFKKGLVYHAYNKNGLNESKCIH